MMPGAKRALLVPFRIQFLSVIPALAGMAGLWILAFTIGTRPYGYLYGVILAGR